MESISHLLLNDFEQVTACYYSPYGGEHDPNQTHINECVDPTFILAQS